MEQSSYRMHSGLNYLQVHKCAITMHNSTLNPGIQTQALTAQQTANVLNQANNSTQQVYGPETVRWQQVNDQAQVPATAPIPTQQTRNSYYSKPRPAFPPLDYV